MRFGKISILTFCFLSSTAWAEHRLPFTTVFKGRDRFDRLVAQAKANDWKSLSIGERTAAVGQALVGTRYKSFTLEIDNHIEAASANLNGLDCWTFFEIALGFARMLEKSPRIGRREDCCTTSSSIVIAAANAPAIIFPDCIISKTGFTITIGADWSMISRATSAALVFRIPRAK